MRFHAAAALLAAPLALGAAPARAQTADPALAGGTLLEVSAEGRSARVPDVATIRAGVTTQAATAAAALADNAARLTRVLAALARAGVAPRDVQTAAVSLQPQYRYAEGQPPAVTGYQASNSVAVRFRAISEAGAVLDALVAQGANQLDGPTLAIDQPEAALDEARTDAVARARARADRYAGAAGLRVVRILQITEGTQSAGDQPRPPVMFARVAAAPATPTPVLAGEREVTAAVTMRFLLR